MLNAQRFKISSYCLLVTYFVVGSIPPTPSLDWLFNVLVNAPSFGSEEMRVVALITLSMTVYYAIPLLVKSLIDRLPRYSQELTSLYYALATILIIIYSNTSSPDFIYVQY